MKNMINKEILKIALNTQNLSNLSNCTHSSKLRNSYCGDEIKIYMNLKNGKVIDFKYEGESCIYSQASASLLAKTIKNKNINLIKKLIDKANKGFQDKNNKPINKQWKSFLKLMNKNNLDRKNCLLLPLKATLKALKD
tara:strand:- start:83 stop:496 length:414 start_codon:yes stop_codon:yes gene_type:complete